MQTSPPIPTRLWNVIYFKFAARQHIAREIACKKNRLTLITAFQWDQGVMSALSVSLRQLSFLQINKNKVYWYLCLSHFHCPSDKVFTN